MTFASSHLRLASGLLLLVASCSSSDRLVGRWQAVADRANCGYENRLFDRKHAFGPGGEYQGTLWALDNGVYTEVWSKYSGRWSSPRAGVVEIDETASETSPPMPSHTRRIEVYEYKLVSPDELQLKQIEVRVYQSPAFADVFKTSNECRTTYRKIAALVR